MKWYEATKFGIEPVEVIRETDYFLILAKGGRVPKNSGWRWYRPTFEGAREAALKELRQEYQVAKNTVERLKERVKKFEEMKETC